ncbi:MAG: hypothetical protein KAX44_06540 [Candidatus Brocadiae bacterium]|nr:hypothetical protein [Candidatus Brocadiia bacterium]
MKQNTVIHILLGMAVLAAIPLLYLLLAPHGQTKLSPSQWAMFGGLALALVLAVFVSSLLRRLRGPVPPQLLSPADIRFCVLVTVVTCALVFFGVWACGPLGSLAMMLVPLSFTFRFRRPRVQRDDQ